MKSLVSVVSALIANRTTRYNLASLGKLIAALVLLIALYSVVFHFLMEREGQEHSWITGVYWTLTVMSTLGFGDITFGSDAGRFFSIVVLVSGVLFLLVLLPFTFIEFFYAPWMKAQDAAQAPKKVPSGTHGHVILTRCGPVARRLMLLLDEYGYPYFFIAGTIEEALRMRDDDLPAVVGDLSDPDTYQRMAIEKAAMVVTTLDDITNTNITFTIRDACENIPIVASATTASGRDALDLVGVTHILQLHEMMGQALARRVVSNDAEAHVIGELDSLIIAEASPDNTTLVGSKICEIGLRSKTGLTIVGIWDHGEFQPVDADSVIKRNHVLVLAGTKEQIERYNEAFGQPRTARHEVIIVGGGRVGRATAKALSEAKIPSTVIEKQRERVAKVQHKVIGDASDFEIATKAGVREAESIIITSHDDDTNIFLTLFFRRLRSDVQIICRSTHEKNVSRMQRAGADLVLSYAAMGANSIFNELRSSDTLLLAEGVNIFSVRVPKALVGKTVAKSAVRSRTGCSIIALEADGQQHVNPDPDIVMAPASKIVLIGTLDAEKTFLKVFKLGDRT